VGVHPEHREYPRASLKLASAYPLADDLRDLTVRRYWPSRIDHAQSLTTCENLACS